MNNLDIAIPFSAFFDIHEIKDHEPKSRSITVTMTVTIRMKFSRLKNMQELMEAIVNTDPNSERLMFKYNRFNTVPLF